MTANPEQPNSSAFAQLRGIQIARISTVPFYVAAQLKHQIAFLGQQGANVTVVSRDEPEQSEFAGLPGVSYHAIDIPRAISPWRDFKALLQLIRFFRKKKIQVAHSTTPKAGLLTAVAAFLANVPIRLHTFTGQQWVAMQGVKRRVSRLSDIVIGRLNTRCYTDSPSQRQFLIDEKLLPPSRLFVLGAGSLAGVDIRRFSRERFSLDERQALRRSLNIPQSATVLLFIGRITLDKGVKELLLAFQNLKALGNNAHLVFVGRFDTDSGVEGNVSADDLKNIQDVHLAGYTEIPEAYMAITDVLCLPSYREGFGTVVIEAAAMGVPTLGTDIYGLSDAVAHNETGILVPPRNVEALTDALKRLLANAELRSKMGIAARQRAHDKFDAEKLNHAVAEEYVSLLSNAAINAPTVHRN